jgi:hypothetical protein
LAKKKKTFKQLHVSFFTFTCKFKTLFCFFFFKKERVGKKFLGVPFLRNEAKTSGSKTLKKLSFAYE